MCGNQKTKTHKYESNGMPWHAAYWTSTFSSTGPGLITWKKNLDQEVTVRDCRPLFEILAQGDGQITIAEFCKGLMQIKGQARALDIVVTWSCKI